MKALLPMRSQAAPLPPGEGGRRPGEGVPHHQDNEFPTLIRPAATFSRREKEDCGTEDSEQPQARPRRLGAVALLLSTCTHAVVCQAQIAVPPRAPYAQTAETLERFLNNEVVEKRLPAISIALVDDQNIVWARGFGFADLAKKSPANAETIYRVGSVSKLFTDIAAMRLVEAGKLDLDAPVARILPSFRPKNPFDISITPRQLMAHRAGLVRESPVGNYFDATNPTLRATVESLNQTELVFKPGARTKYSNAGVAALGRVLEQATGEPFEKLIKRLTIEPIGLKRSFFEPDPGPSDNRAQGAMWSYDGRRFPAPTFVLGTPPAGNLDSTALDLARFLELLFAGGKTPQGRILKEETLRSMWDPQFAKNGEATTFGLGFTIGELDGAKRIGHGGAVYGFATELAALPDEKLGVVAIASLDGANGATKHVADLALRLMRAARAGKPAPNVASTTPVGRDRARRLEGRYGKGPDAIDLAERDGKLFLSMLKGGFRVEIRSLGEELVVDDVLARGASLKVQGDGDRSSIVFLGKTLDRAPVEPPRAPPKKWLGLIGEYGWDYNTLFILEKDGKLHALIEWFYLYPLEEIAPETFKFPDWGLYEGESLRFSRDADGRATRVVAANVTFPRRPIAGEDGKTFRLQPIRPVAELRNEAIKARPPAETGDFRESDLIDVAALDPTIKLDIRYATTNNFLSTPFYTTSRAFLQRPAAEALLRAHKSLKEKGFGLLIHDGYRPWHVTKMFWDATPPPSRMFVADPSEGSRHNRGCAVDLSMYELQTGEPASMVGGYDEFSDRARPDYPGGTSLQRSHRRLLRVAMEDQGFNVNVVEWWHFDHRDWKHYPIGNATFEELAKPSR